MTILSIITLFFIMAALAALPSSSVLLVVAQSATRGFQNGLATAIGVVSGDLIFMFMAILGMTALAEQMGTLFFIIKYLAAAYLIWFGISLIRSTRLRKTDKNHQNLKDSGSSSSLLGSYGAGLLLTLGDVKAIFFYASLLPSFIDLTSLKTVDVVIISLITVISVGGVKTLFAFGATFTSSLAGSFAHQNKLKIASGGLMTAAGAYILLRD